MTDFKFKPEERNLSKKIAVLIGVIISITPGDKAKKKSYLELISEDVKLVSETSTAAPARPLKAISDALTDVLHGIVDVLPTATDVQNKVKAKFGSAVKALNGVLDLIGL